MFHKILNTKCGKLNSSGAHQWKGETTKPVWVVEVLYCLYQAADARLEQYGQQQNISKNLLNIKW